MCPDVKTLDDLIACLRTGLRDDGAWMLFGADLVAEAAQLAGYVVTDAPPSFRIDQHPGQDIIQPNAPADVKVTGVAKLFDDVSYNVVIVGTVPSPGVVRFTMSLAPVDTATWTFGSNFPGLPDYTGYDYESRRIRRLPSFFYDTVVNATAAGAPVFFAQTAAPAGLTVEATLDATKGTIGAQVGIYLPPGERSALPLTGTIVVRKAKYPLLELVAAIPGFTVDERLGQIDLELGTGDLPVDEGSSTAEMVATTLIPGFPPLYVRGPVLEGDYTWIVTATIENPQDYSLRNGLSSL